LFVFAFEFAAADGLAAVAALMFLEHEKKTFFS